MALENQEKDYLLQYLTKTRDILVARSKGFSIAQQQFKPSSEVWSVEELFEHLSLTEKGFFHAIVYAFEQPAMTREEVGHRSSDNYIQKGLQNRVFKVDSPSRVTPKGGVGINASMEKFLEWRAKMIDIVEKGEGEWHNHYWSHPFFGPINVYQIVLCNCSHEERHLLQLDEIISQSDFPK
jgi:DinB superfamily